MQGGAKGQHGGADLVDLSWIGSIEAFELRLQLLDGRQQGPNRGVDLVPERSAKQASVLALQQGHQPATQTHEPGCDVLAPSAGLVTAIAFQMGEQSEVIDLDVTDQPDGPGHLAAEPFLDGVGLEEAMDQADEKDGERQARENKPSKPCPAAHDTPRMSGRSARAWAVLASDRGSPNINRQTRFRGLGAPAGFATCKTSDGATSYRLSQTYEERLTRGKTLNRDFSAHFEAIEMLTWIIFQSLRQTATGSNFVPDLEPVLKLRTIAGQIRPV